MKLALKFDGATYPGPNRLPVGCSRFTTTESAIVENYYYYYFIKADAAWLSVWMRWKPRSSKQNYAILFVQSTFSHTETRNGFCKRREKMMASTLPNDRVNSKFNWCWLNNKAEKRTKMRREPQTTEEEKKKRSTTETEIAIRDVPQVRWNIVAANGWHAKRWHLLQTKQINIEWERTRLISALPYLCDIMEVHLKVSILILLCCSHYE